MIVYVIIKNIDKLEFIYLGGIYEVLDSSN